MKHRLLRVNEVVKRELSMIITRDMKFEDVLVTVNTVDVTPDLRNAHVFVSVLGKGNAPAVLAALAITVAGTSAVYALAVVTPLLRSPAGVYLQPLIAGVARRHRPPVTAAGSATGGAPRWNPQ